jgi:glycine/D-amino acid oxidase-like deaminating enzyme
MTTHTSQPFTDEIQARLISRILLDPGIPRQAPTVPTWQLPPHPLAEAQSSELSRFTDFAIIGSGVTGCAVAKTLLESSQSGQRTVTVFEARTLASGASSRNAGFLKSHIPTSFSNFVKEYGKEEAIVFSRFANRTSQKMRDLVAMQESDGDYTSEMRDVRCISAYRDKKTLEMVISSIKHYEESFPEHKGQFSLVDQGTLEKVVPETLQTDICFR